MKYVSTLSVSAKTARVTLAGSKHLLAFAGVSDSISALPPNLYVYSIGAQFLSRIQTVNGPCFSLGRALVPFRHGFYATAPASAYRWGDPGAIMVRIIPPMDEFTKISTTNIPFGETFASSYSGNVQIACSPYSEKYCIVIKKNISTILKTKESTKYFGLGVAISPNGSVIATLSSGANNYALLHFYDEDLNVISSFSIPHDPELTPRSSQVYLYFRDERHIIVGFFNMSHVHVYKNTVNGWLLDQTYNLPITAMAPIDDNLATLTIDGRVQVFDHSFVSRGEEIVPRSMLGSKFTSIAAGRGWFAVLEESQNKRKIHVYSTIRHPIWRTLGLFTVLILIAFVSVFIKVKVDMGRLLNRVLKKKDSKQV